MRVAALPWLLACKVDAFSDRGAGDPLASTDLEDIVALVDGCPSIIEEVGRADERVRAFLARWCSWLLERRDLLEIAEGQLPLGGAEADRRRRFRATLRALGALA